MFTTAVAALSGGTSRTTTPARRIVASCTHAVFSGQALERLERSDIEEVVVTNTIPLRDEQTCKKITILSVAPLLGEAIRRIHTETSVSSLFV